MPEYRESSLIKNAFILSSAAILSKVVGAFYQAFLYQIVGSAGVGIYMKGISFYAMLLAVSASGIPIAISKLMAEERSRGNYRTAKRIFSYSTMILTILGAIFSFGLFFFAPFISERIFQDPRTLYVLQAMSPALLVVTIMGAFRGYFQGHQNMLPTGLSQIVEQLARVAFSVGITLFFVRTFEYIPVIRIINGIALGPFVGALFGIIVLILYLVRDYNRSGEVLTDRNPGGNRALVKRILLFAIPVTMSALLPTLMDVVEGVVMPNGLLDSGFSIEKTDALYGSFSGAVMALVNLIVATSSAFATSIVPAISAALARNNIGEVVRKVNLSIKMVCLISIPAGFGLLFLGEPVLDLIFNAPDAVRILQFSVLMVLFIGLYHNTTGILQGMGRTYIPIISLSAGLLVNVILLQFFLTLPAIREIAAPLAYTGAYLIAFLVNYQMIRKTLDIHASWLAWIPQVTISALASAVTAVVIYYPFFHLIHNFTGKSIAQLVAILLGVAAAVVVYLFSLILSKGITREEAMSIPRLNRIMLKLYRLVGSPDGE